MNTADTAPENGDTNTSVPKGAMAFIVATIVLDAVGVGIIFPIMPDLMDEIGATSTANGALLGGLLLASYALMQFLFSPLIGNLSDAYGRRPVLLLSLAALAFDYVLMGVAYTFWLLLVGRIIAGIAGATYTTASAYLADISPPDKRAANFGLIGAAFGVGFILGPAIGGLVATIDTRAPFFLAAVLAALNFAFGYFMLPESLSKDRKRPFQLRDSSPLRALRQIIKLKELRSLLIALFILDLAMFVYPAVWAYYGRAAFNWSTPTIGLSLANYGVAVAIVQGWMIRLIVPKFGEARTAMIGLIAAICAGFGYAIAPSGLIAFALIPLAALGDLTPAALTGILSNRVSDNQQGLLQGVLASMAAIQSIVGPLIMTGSFQLFAGDTFDMAFYGAPFLLCAVMLVTILPILVRLVQGRV